jgi:hypothetical protein
MSDRAASEAKAPLDDVMLAMDVVDTLRHRQDLVARELDGAARERQLIERLRDIYHQQGIEVPDRILKEGVAALAESRFVYTPPPPGLGVTLARAYVARGRWGPAALALALVLVIGLGGYFLAWRPFVAGQAEAARLELAEGLPHQMDELRQAIFIDTKVQAPLNEADEIVRRGKVAAAEGNRAAAETAIAQLTILRDRIRQDYAVTIVSRPGTQSGFWTFPESNTDATNYYVVVEALGTDGKPLSLPIRNEETGETETVNVWGLRVPESVYRSVEADKQDDGIVQRNVVGVKQYGFPDVEYAVPVLGGAVTRW